VTFLLLLIIVAGIAIRATSTEERERVFRALRESFGRARAEATRPRPQLDGFQTALRERTPRVFVTHAIVALNVAVFVLMLVSPGSLADPETLVKWGASVGPRTTNGEWWRLATAMFVHTGFLHLLVNVAVLLQAGLIVERMFGPLGFAASYLGAGMVATAVSLWVDPVAVAAGASPAVFSVLGLLSVVCVNGFRHPSPVTIPFIALRRLTPALALFIVYTAAADETPRAPVLAALAIGIASGVAFTIRVPEGKPDAKHVAIAAAVSIVLAAAVGLPQYGLSDVRPEIARIVAAEDHLANAYETSLERFRKGKLTAESLADRIEGVIVPQLESSRARLKGMKGIPASHQFLVDGLDEYLRLRTESWQLRADGLRRPNMHKLQQAERMERASLEALDRVKTQIG
jgi:rhomboid protease GluP